MNNHFHHPIRKRLQRALLLLIGILSVFFVICMLLLVFWFERSLFYDHLNSDLDNYISVYQETKSPFVKSQGDTIFYKMAASDETLLPKHFQGYQEGSYEVLHDSGAYNLFIRNSVTFTYALVQDQSEFERYEILAIISAIIGTLLISWGGIAISRRLAEKILSPLLHLADAVSTSGSEEVNVNLKLGQYPADEVGLLANAVQHYANKVSELLEREQQFTADVSHELRTPMMVIKSSCELLEESSDLPDMASKPLARIDRALVEMQSQVELYLQLARSPQERHLSEEEHSLLSAASEALQLWQGKAMMKNIQLDLQAEPAMQTSQVPIILMSSVLNNLLRNALNHTDEGVITLIVDSTSIAIVDTGEGIDPVIADSIFYRGVRSIKGPSSRYGLGLSIVKRVCDHQGWELTVEQNQPRGTRFIVTVLAS